MVTVLPKRALWRSIDELICTLSSSEPNSKRSRAHALNSIHSHRLLHVCIRGSNSGDLVRRRACRQANCIRWKIQSKRFDHRSPITPVRHLLTREQSEDRSQRFRPCQRPWSVHKGSFARPFAWCRPGDWNAFDPECECWQMLSAKSAQTRTSVCDLMGPNSVATSLFGLAAMELGRGRHPLDSRECSAIPIVGTRSRTSGELFASSQTVRAGLSPPQQWATNPPR